MSKITDMKQENKGFYPTPKELIKKLELHKNVRGSVLEPSAGTGSLLEDLDLYGDSSADVIELDPDLSSILIGKGYKQVETDFLNYNPTKQYDWVLMNPPFANGDEHLIHSIKLGEKQIKSLDIRCIINAETIKNPYSNKRKELISLLEKYNAKITYVEDGFSNAERSTKVEIAYIEICVTNKNKYKKIFDDFVENTTLEISKKYESTALSTHINKENGAVALNEDEVDILIRLYDKQMEMLFNYFQAKEELFNFENNISLYFNNLTENKGYNNFYRASQSNYELNQEIESVKIRYWKKILNSDKLSSMLTNEAIEGLEKNLSEYYSLDFTKENIINLINVIMYNFVNIMQESSLELFNKFTGRSMYSSQKNIHLYNGWKTNDAFIIKPKIIVSGYELSKWDDSVELKGANEEIVNDILKTIKIFSTNKDGASKVHETSQPGVYLNEYLKVKVFKKGTLHVWFNDLEALKGWNIFAGKANGGLPDDEELATNKEAREFLNDFEKNQYGKLLK